MQKIPAVQNILQVLFCCIVFHVHFRLYDTVLMVITTLIMIRAISTLTDRVAPVHETNLAVPAGQTAIS